MKMFYSLYFAAFLLGCVSSAPISSSLWETPCPPDKLSCENGTDIGLVGFEFGRYTRLEHSKQGTYKDLVCYPQNFCSMRWLKDGLPFPWAWSVDMGVAQGVCNSTLMFRRVGLEAAGVYTCEVTGANGTVISRNITLRVKATPPPAPPIVVAGDLCANHTAELGSNVTFRCEIYVGEDVMANSYSYWLMEVTPGEWDLPDYVDLNGTVIHANKENNVRPGYMMSELQIFNASHETFVRYELHVSTSRMNSVTNFHLQPPSSPIPNENIGDSDNNCESNDAYASTREGSSSSSWKTLGIVILCVLGVVVALVVIVVIVYMRRLISSKVKAHCEYHKPKFDMTA
ncbi:uncharacterized protein LOC764822 isoform X1 [Strongylocentrotus purpuratus]|uniref:Soluble interferon alpha/beta receptor OPG204 n=1 Tax=Strongylocentrotus purpuratus TaxID=7668 RepID=A0A7M7HFR2_STRPU|nr:uncharacterized protein LOC764822 isoform X1 [Strongylocentrotus purpuratus]